MSGATGRSRRIETAKYSGFIASAIGLTRGEPAWTATLEGDRRIGTGPTEQAAKDDLLRQIDEVPE